MTTKRKTIDTTWEIWTYDVWGNEEDGAWVNDRYCIDRSRLLKLKVITCNQGTTQEFQYATPSDYQLQSLFNVRCAIDCVVGDDINIYPERASDGYPLGELHCISHESLSPIILIS